ncbi:MAG: hypothetical protein KAS32_21855 [Candidatus Peribacteraceae bacterium]|nr:hypothetical protein [Candidatus Peribacteraceae bacterium]
MSQGSDNLDTTLKPTVPQVAEGIELKKVGKETTYVCQCGNANKKEFTDFLKAEVIMGERMRKKNVHVQCLMCNLCDTSVPYSNFKKKYFDKVKV